MANRYWVGGTASWDGTAGTKWAGTSGGAGGVSVPTSVDDVFFDANSGIGTVTIASGNTGAKSINFAGFTGTLGTSTATIVVSGNVTLSAGMTCNYRGRIEFTNNATLTSAGKTLGIIWVATSGITLTLGDALNLTDYIYHAQGTLTTANYAMTMPNYLGGAVSDKILNLGSSTVTVTASGSISEPWEWRAPTTASQLNAGTSQINLTSNNGPVFQSTGSDPANPARYYNVSFTSTATQTCDLTKINNTHFNNLSIASPLSGTTFVPISSNITISGTFTCSGSSRAARIFIGNNNNPAGAPDSPTNTVLTVGTALVNNCDFRRITFSGGASGVAPSGAGDCGENSNIVFPAGRTVYRVGTSSIWADSNWALTSGGTASIHNYPLAQDTVIFNNGITPSGSIIRHDIVSSYTTLPGIDASARTASMTLAFSGSTFLAYGNLNLSSALTVPTSTSALISFDKVGVQTITSNGCNFAVDASVGRLGTTLQLLDAYLSNGDLRVVNEGTFDANGYNVTVYNFTATGFGNFLMGSGLWTTIGPGNAFSVGSNAGHDPGTANILLLQGTFADTRVGAKNYNRVTFGTGSGGGSFLISHTTTPGATLVFNEIASQKTSAFTILLNSSGYVFNNWLITGTLGNVVTFNSNTAGTRRTFSLTNKTISGAINYLSVKDIGELNGNKFYVGTTSTDGGNNSNVYFTDAVPDASPGGMFFLF